MVFLFCLRILDAICQNFQLELDDIVILSTDGLFDNVPDQLIERILSRVSPSSSSYIPIRSFSS